MTAKIEALKLLPIRLGITRLSVGWRFTLCALVMVIYMVVSREIYNTADLTFAEIELRRTPFRLLTALTCWLLMADVMFESDGKKTSFASLPLLVGLSLMMIDPILTRSNDDALPEVIIVALASFPVGLSEELFYRGVIQTLFVKYMGAVQGIGTTALIFTLFHIGVIGDWYIDVFLTGVILGIIYWKTKSLMTVVLLHALYDVLVSLPINSLLPNAASPVLQLSAALFIFAWSKRTA